VHILERYSASYAIKPSLSWCLHPRCQVNKAQLSKSVVDDTNVTRLFSSRELEGLFRLEHPDSIPEEERQDYAPKLVSLLELLSRPNCAVGAPFTIQPKSL